MIFLFFATILLGIVFQKSKIVRFLQVLVGTIIFSFNTDNPDYSGYFGTYNAYYTRDIYWDYFQRYDPFYKAFVILCNKLHISFNLFRVLVFLICISLIITTIRKMTNRINLVLSLYMIFPFVMDCIQIRNYIGSAIVIYSMQFLFYTSDKAVRKNNIYRYVLGILIASMFHYVTILYSMFLLVLFPSWFKKVFPIGVCCSVAFTLCKYFDRTRYNNPLSYFHTNVSLITFVFLSGLSIGMMLIVYYYMKKNRDEIIEDDFKNRLFRFFLMSLIFVPITVFHFDLFRFIRNILLIYSAAAGYYLTKIRTVHNKRNVLVLSEIVITSFFIVAYAMLLWRSAYYPYDESLISQMINSIEICL